MMSNALYFGGPAGPCSGPLGACIAAVTQPAGPATAPAEGLPLAPQTLILLGVGTVVLFGWLVLMLSRPGRLRLHETSPRHSEATLLHAAVAWILWQFATAGAFTMFAGLLAPASAGQAASQPATQAASAPASQATTARATQPATQATSQPAEAVKDPRVMFASMATGEVVLFALCLIIAARTFRGGVVNGLGLSLKHPLRDLGGGVAGYLAVYPVCLGLLFVCTLLMDWIAPQLIRIHEVLIAVREVGTGWKVVAALGTVVLAPLAEEVFFRGLVQTWFRGALRSPGLAIVITSAIFALVHTGLEPQALPSLFVLALALGYNYERTGRLTSSILIHAIFNGVSLAGVIL